MSAAITREAAKITKEGSSFHRGDVLNMYPYDHQLWTDTGPQDYILRGWMPSNPFIGPSANIVAFGSCFASNIGKYLMNLGFDIATAREGKAYVQRISDGLVNVFAICQQFEWAWENRTPTVELWHGWKAEEFGYDESVRLATKDLFDKADVFILTFGLSEIWYDEPTGETFWRAIPAGKFDKTRHKFRVATAAETLERLRRIYDLIRKHRPGATIIFTLSPIGLAATFRNVACVTANSVSKALLRSAIDELHRSAADSNFFYFPSYEMVLNGFRTPFVGDLRHPHTHVIKANLKAFERYFCTTGMTDADLQKEIKEARDLDTAVTFGDRKDVLPILTQLKNMWRAQEPASSAHAEARMKIVRARLFKQRLATKGVVGEAAEESIKRMEARRARVARRKSELGDTPIVHVSAALSRAEKLKLRADRIAAREARLKALQARKAAKRRAAE